MTQSSEDYLEAIYRLIEESKTAQVRDVARLLKVKMPSVVKAIRELMRQGLVKHEPYADIELTTAGLCAARMVLNRHKLLCSFLMKLGVNRQTADEDACRMEHVLSSETLDKIRIYTETEGNQ